MNLFRLETMGLDYVLWHFISEIKLTATNKQHFKSRHLRQKAARLEHKFLVTFRNVDLIKSTDLFLKPYLLEINQYLSKCCLHPTYLSICLSKNFSHNVQTTILIFLLTQTV